MTHALARDRRRRVTALLILVAWAAGLVALARRDFFRTPAEIIAEAAMLQVGPSATYFVVERDGRQIGFASTSIDTTVGTFEVLDQFIADLPVDGRTFRSSTITQIRLTRTFALRAFDVRMETPERPLSAVGQVTGDSVVRYVLRTRGQPNDTQRVAVQGPILIPTLLPVAAMLVAEPKIGRRVTLSAFDPSTMAPSETQLRIEAESLFTVVDSAMFDSTANRFVAAHSDTVRAWHLVTVTDAASATGRTAAIPFNGWVDRQGNVVEATQPNGLTLRRIAYEIAFNNWRRANAEAAGGSAAVRGAGDVIEGTAIAAGALATRRGFGALRVQLGGVPLDGFALDGGRQVLSGDTLRIQREGEIQLAPDWNLWRIGRGFRQLYADELTEEPLLEVNSREIVDLAVRVAGNSRDPREIAQRLNKWVYDSLAKEVSVGAPSALATLRARRGDAAEHAQLFVALARAAGIPARVASGLAYVNGNFYYHAWPEVLLRGWVAVDPTFGQFPADAGHLRFVSGGQVQQAELLRLLGNLQINVLEAR